MRIARPVRSLVTSLAMLCLVGLITGCTVEVHDDSGNNEHTSSPSSAASGSLEVQNNTATTIFKIRFSRVDDPSWGEDKLGAAEVVMPNTSRSWPVPAGAYHVKIEFEDGRALDSLEEYNVPAGGSAVCNVHN
jgi:hypothetical protein